MIIQAPWRAVLMAGLLAGLAACASTSVEDRRTIIDKRVDTALEAMFETVPNTSDLAANAAGMLVFPLMTESGIFLGGGYGRGALRVDGESVAYYSATRANFGLQFGAQQYSYVLFFMTPEALHDFRESGGLAAGVDLKYAEPDGGGTVRFESTLAFDPVIPIVAGHAGMLAGVTIEGIKYTRLNL